MWAKKAIYRVRCILTKISPELNTRFNYFVVHHRWLNLRHPKTFEEKVLWLKLKDYMKNPLVIQCADKYRVRTYVEEKGCGEMLNTLIGAYDTVGEVPWDKLPERFVLKWNFGSGYNLICPDKQKLSIEEAKKTLTAWSMRKYWLPYAEMQYENMPQKLICETFLEDQDNGKALVDYKVYCFHGEPQMIMVMNDRGEELKREFFDTDWVRQPNPKGKPAPAIETPRPVCLGEMLEAARKLTAPFPFVRCDFYVVNGRPIFGELTFTPATGVYVAHTTLHGRNLTELLRVDEG